jgi:predicted secreted Zn-dependent protease
VKHIVAWKFKEYAENSEKSANLARAKTLLESLKGKIAQITALEVGIDVSHTDHSFDLVLNTEFDSRAALVAYQQHPEHVKIVEFLRRVQSARIVVDYEV